MQFSKLIRISLIFCTFLAYALPTRADFSCQQRHREAYQEIFRWRLDLAKSHLEAATQENAFTWYLQNYLQALQSIASHDKEKYKDLRKDEKKILEKLQKLDKNSPYYLFFQAEILLQNAFVALYYEDALEAAQNLKKALKMLQNNEKQFPNFLPNKKTLGLLRVIISAIPQQHQWLSNFLGIKDAKSSQGAAQVLEVAQSQDFFSPEAQLIYALLQTYLLDNAQYGKDFLEKISKNWGREQQIGYFVKALLAYKAHAPQQAWENLQKIQIHKENPEIVIVYYLKAETFLLLEKYDKALLNYNNFLTYYKGKHYIKDCFYKMFVAYYLSENPKYYVYYHLIPKRGSKISLPDQYAQEFYETKELVSPLLFRARLLTDGGQAQKAYHFLDSVGSEKFTKNNEQIEFYYRKARAAHLSQQTEKAILLYEQVIKLQKTEKYYFAPNALLQLGYIFAENDTNKAKTYFQKVFEYQKYPYQSSLESKAKIALAKVKAE